VRCETGMRSAWFDHTRTPRPAISATAFDMMGGACSPVIYHDVS
jgi:hypothetical protein